MNRHLSSSVTLLGFVVLALAAGACGESGPPYEVTIETASGPGTQELTVWRPTGSGPWPVVYAIPGSGGEATRDFDVFAGELASHGVLVIGTDFFTARADNDVECGYRHARTIAADFAGDLARPVTVLGFSAGATFAMRSGLGEKSYGPESTLDIGCPPGAERPDIVVSINGCHTQDDLAGRVPRLGKLDARLTLIAADGDTVCDPQESRDAATVLAGAGYDTAYVEIADADHGRPVFKDGGNNWASLPADDAAGQATVRAVLDAIGVEGASRP